VSQWRWERRLEQRFGFADPTVFDDLREEDERRDHAYARMRVRDILIYPLIIGVLAAGLITAARVLTGAHLADAAAGTYALGGLVALVDIAAKFIHRRDARRTLTARRSPGDVSARGSRAGRDS
jgi:hypothetical protein